jgi:hypothetical protein
MSGVNASDSFFTDVRTSAPANAIAALVRRNIGPTGDHYLGEDNLLLVNLTEAPLSNPALGVGTPGSSFSEPLLVRGFARNSAFGGSGEIALNQLPAESVYATLIGENEHLNVNVSVSGIGVTEIPFDTLDVLYLTALPGDFNHNGVVDAADYTVWRDTLGSTTDLAADGDNSGKIDAGDFTVWKMHFGEHSDGSGAKSTAAVPEPATLPLLGPALLALVLNLRRRSGDLIAAEHSRRKSILPRTTLNGLDWRETRCNCPVRGG